MIRILKLLAFSLVLAACGRQNAATLNHVTDKDYLRHIPAGTKFYLKADVNIKPNSYDVLTYTTYANNESIKKTIRVSLVLASAHDRILPSTVGFTFRSYDVDVVAGGRASVIRALSDGGVGITIEAFSYNRQDFLSRDNLTIGDLRKVFNIVMPEPVVIQ